MFFQKNDKKTPQNFQEIARECNVQWLWARMVLERGKMLEKLDVGLSGLTQLLKCDFIQVYLTVSSPQSGAMTLMTLKS